MKHALEHIRQAAVRLGEHPFFERLRAEPDLRRAMAFAPAGTFWVMTFQDILRMNVDLTTDRAVRKLMEKHRAEDAGHEEWFLQDLRTIFGEEVTSIRRLFSADHQGVRAVSFRLASEVFRVSDDRLRLVLVEVLEAAAAVYFGRISRALAVLGRAAGLRYFAGVHLAAEAGHEIHADEQRDALGAIELPGALRGEAEALIGRMFAAFSDLGDALVERMDAARAADAIPTAHRTFRSFGHERLGALCSAVGMDSSLPAAMTILDRFMSGWGDRALLDRPSWRSNITDDHTPFELSLAIQDGRPELRFLIEAQGQPMSTLDSIWDAGCNINEQLQRAYGVSLDRLRRVEDLFRPHDPNARFSMWHAICLREGEPPDIKMYLNPRARGAPNAMALVAEAFHRNGFYGAVYFVTDRVLRSPRDHIVYFSLDLASGGDPRVKVYAAHPGITSWDVEAHMAVSGSDLLPGEASAFCRALAGHDGPYDGLPLDICYAFTNPASDMPSEVTLYLPIRSYVGDDREAAQRIDDYLEPDERPLWQAALESVARRPLEAGRGLVQWVSLKRRRGQRRVTFYFTPEAYAPLPASRRPTSPDPQPDAR